MTKDIFKKINSSEELKVVTVCSSKENQKNISFFQRICPFFKERLFFYLAIFFAIVGLVFLIFGIKEWLNPEQKIHVDLLTAFGSCYIAAAFLYSIYWNIFQKNKETSQFYLSKIQKYLNNSVDYISAENNNNVAWHRAANLLKSVENLYKNLTEKDHKEIFIRDYMDAGFAIVDIINSIDSYLFFYGVNNYKEYINDDSANEILYEESGGSSLDIKRISPEALMFFCALYEKVNFLFFKDMDNSLNYSVLNEPFFKKIDSSYELNHFSKDAPVVKKVFKYIENLNRLSGHK